MARRAPYHLINVRDDDVRTLSEERFGEMVEAEVYMRSIMQILGVSTPREALERVKRYDEISGPHMQAVRG